MAAGDAVATVVRDERRGVLATMIRVTGSVDLAEDVTQDAILRALEVWPAQGIPPNPRAWLLLTARRRAVDVVRRESRRAGKEAESLMLAEADKSGAFEEPGVVRDDLLRLLFTCCHPTLSLDAQVALALRTLGGLTTSEVARALLVPEPTIAKRLTRTKQKIALAGIPYRVPRAEELPDRLAGVATTVYLIFNEGYASTASGGDVIRDGLIDEAIRLGRLMFELMPDEPTVIGLLALMLLHDARRETRSDAEGLPVVMADQNRSEWDRAKIEEGVSLVGLGLRRTPNAANFYVVQAAVAACHCLAVTSDETDWRAIVSWYDVLLTISPSPVVQLNRAAAIAEYDGADAALALVDAIDGLYDYPWWHASRAELLRRTGQAEDARAALMAAVAHGLNSRTAEYLQRKIDQTPVTGRSASGG